MAEGWCSGSGAYVKGTSQAHGGSPVARGVKVKCPRCSRMVGTRKVRVGLRWRSEYANHKSGA